MKISLKSTFCGLIVFLAFISLIFFYLYFCSTSSLVFRLSTLKSVYASVLRVRIREIKNAWMLRVRSPRWECKWWRFMRDYAKCGLLSLLIPVFRRTTGVSAIGSPYTIEICRCVLPDQWDLPPSYRMEKKLQFERGWCRLRCHVLCSSYLNTFYSLSLSNLGVAILTKARLELWIRFHDRQKFV